MGPRNQTWNHGLTFRAWCFPNLTNCNWTTCNRDCSTSDAESGGGATCWLPQSVGGARDLHRSASNAATRFSHLGCPELQLSPSSEHLGCPSPREGLPWRRPRLATDEHGPLELVSKLHELKAMVACAADVVPLSPKLCGTSMVIVEKDFWAREEPGSTRRQLGMQKTEKENAMSLFFRASKKKFEQNGLSQTPTVLFPINFFLAWPRKQHAHSSHCNTKTPPQWQCTQFGGSQRQTKNFRARFAAEEEDVRLKRQQSSSGTWQAGALAVFQLSFVGR